MQKIRIHKPQCTCIITGAGDANVRVNSKHCPAHKRRRAEFIKDGRKILLVPVYH